MSIGCRKGEDLDGSVTYVTTCVYNRSTAKVSGGTNYESVSNMPFFFSYFTITSWMQERRTPIVRKFLAFSAMHLRNIKCGVIFTDVYKYHVKDCYDNASMKDACSY